MSVFGKIYDGVVDMLIDKQKIEEYGTKGAEPIPIEECPDCMRHCSPTCECRWCHFSSCAKCDEENCNIRTCPDPCHGDKGGKYVDNEPVMPLPSMYEADEDFSQYIQNSKVQSYSPESSQLKKKIDIKKLVEGIAGDAKTEINFQKAKEQDKEKLKIERKGNNVGTSLGLQIEAIDEKPVDEKPKIRGKRTSKFTGLLNATVQDESGKFVSDNKRTFTNKSVIAFKSKSKSKEKNRDRPLMNQIEAQIAEDKIDVDTKKKISLAGKLKEQFIHTKISDMNTPDKLDIHVSEKFKREKSEITKFMHKLDDEIRAENYTDKEKLKSNIFEDFEKQESWQSYTTLLFADIKEKENK